MQKCIINAIVPAENRNESRLIPIQSALLVTVSCESGKCEYWIHFFCVGCMDVSEPKVEKTNRKQIGMLDDSSDDFDASNNPIPTEGGWVSDVSVPQ